MSADQVGRPTSSTRSSLAGRAHSFIHAAGVRPAPLRVRAFIQPLFLMWPPSKEANRGVFKQLPSLRWMRTHVHSSGRHCLGACRRAQRCAMCGAQHRGLPGVGLGVAGATGSPDGTQRKNTCCVWVSGGPESKILKEGRPEEEWECSRCTRRRKKFQGADDTMWTLGQWGRSAGLQGADLASALCRSCLRERRLPGCSPWHCFAAALSSHWGIHQSLAD